MTENTLTLQLLGAEVDKGPDESGGEMLRLLTDEGDILCRLHRAAADKGGSAEATTLPRAIVWVFGAGGGLSGPAGGLYERLAQRLRLRGVSSLQIAYRQPGYLKPCVLDTLAGAAFLNMAGLSDNKGRIVLVGHSFGGAVVLTTGTMLPNAAGVAALSSQTFGTEGASRLSPVPLLLIHGEADEVLPDTCSRDIFRRAQKPKELILYPACRHGLDECRDDVDRDLTDWLHRVLW